MTRWTLHEGDCLDLLRGLPAGHVDAVVTDPPYMIGAVSIGNAGTKAGTWADMENSAHWFALWFGECARVLKSTGYLVTMGNWRSLPTLLRACSLCDLSPASCLIWDKQWIGPAAPHQLRPRFELALFVAMKDARIENRSEPDVFSCKWMASHMRTTSHPAEKPEALLRHLVGLVTPPGGLVLDPFAGSGTTGVAALAGGFSFLGAEREPKYAAIARARLTAAAAAAAAPAAPPRARGTQRAASGRRVS